MIAGRLSMSNQPTAAPGKRDASDSAEAFPEIPPPITAVDRLRTLYRSSGPYTSVYLSTEEFLVDEDGIPRSDLATRWRAIRAKLADERAPEAALTAIDARVALPPVPETSGLAVLAAADGTTIVDHGLEPPLFDLGVVDTLPYAAPLLEWQQHRVAHLVVTLDSGGADIVSFGLDHYTRLDSYEVDGPALIDLIARHAEAVQAELVVVAGEPGLVPPVVDALAVTLPARCRVVTETDATDAEELALATVRHVSDAAARITVGHLRDRRFLASHADAVDGAHPTVEALVSGEADRILIHDDPTDQRRIWIGDTPRELSMEVGRASRPARLVDALVWSAVLQDILVHIIPSTGETGPDGDAAALTDRGPRIE